MPQMIQETNKNQSLIRFPQYSQIIQSSSNAQFASKMLFSRDFFEILYKMIFLLHSSWHMRVMTSKILNDIYDIIFTPNFKKMA